MIGTNWDITAEKEVAMQMAAREEAEKAKKALEAAGAKVELK